MLSVDAPDERALRIRMMKERRRISSQHEQLDTFYGMFVDALERGSLRGARVAFMRFKDALDAHIDLEDRVFFPALHGLDPVLEDELRGLVAEHAHIRRELESVQDRLAEGAIETLLTDLDRFASFLVSHEEAEEALLASIVARR